MEYSRAGLSKDIMKRGYNINNCAFARLCVIFRDDVSQTLMYKQITWDRVKMHILI